MAYTAQELITKSFYLSGIVGRNLQSITGDQIYDGLNMLNDLLNFKQIETDLVPYYQLITFPLVPQQEYYYLPYIADIESLTFQLQTVRYGMQQLQRRHYYGSPRANNVYSLPLNWNFNRSLGGGVLAMYFIPDQAYVIQAMVKLFLVDVNLTTDLTNITETFTNPDNIPNFTQYTFVNSSNQGLDTSYIEYLRYALARLICSEYGIMFNPQSEKIYQSYVRKLMYISPPDLTISSQCILNAKDKTAYPSFADVNIGKGWRPA
jgi:hypothetical protein